MKRWKIIRRKGNMWRSSEGVARGLSEDGKEWVKEKEGRKEGRKEEQMEVNI